MPAPQHPRRLSPAARLRSTASGHPLSPRLTVSRRTLLGGSALLAAGGLGLNLSSASAAPGTPTTLLGSWSSGMDADPAVLDRLAASLGYPISIASIFRSPDDQWPYPKDALLGRGRTLLVSWALSDWGSYAWWAAGNGDQLLREQAARLAAYGGPVAIRPWAEMNGDWCRHQVRPAWAWGAPRGGTPDQFVAAWRRVVTVMRSAGATNVRWVFNPTTDTYAETTDIRTFYPGSDVVDIHGLDGYNWGSGLGHTWRTFDDIYAAQYGRLVSLDASKPVWICEISCADPQSPAGPDVAAPTGTSKGQWWEGVASSLSTGYSRIEAVVLFDALIERDWRVTSSPDALAGLRTAVETARRAPE